MNVINNVNNTIKKAGEGLHKTISVNTNNKRQSFGNKAADALTKYAGSWGFIIFFLVFLVVWMMLNVYAWIGRWDPYPFILLNLVLSCLAAIQAPIILMSQNRQSEKDRQKAEYDYAVNRKTEREVEKIQKHLRKLEKKIDKVIK